MGFDAAAAGLSEILALGGPVIAVLLAASALALSVILYKAAQFQALGLGRHRGVDVALAAVEVGDCDAARRALDGSRNGLAPVLRDALDAPVGRRAVLIAKAEAHFARLERGFRLLDSIAQLAPLLGLFGTVLGMIDAFQALQTAGAAVDPALLAGGIWVALLTTAAGLGVAMPTGLALSWLEGRVARERTKMDVALETLLAPAVRPQHGARGTGQIHAL